VLLSRPIRDHVGGRSSWHPFSAAPLHYCYSSPRPCRSYVEKLACVRSPVAADIAALNAADTRREVGAHDFGARPTGRCMEVE
jgi:hypothetical protein